MSDVLRKIGLFGIGVLAITQEKLDEFAQEMVKKGEMNREEGKKFVEEVLSEKERQVKEIRIIVGEKVKDIIENSGFATKKDIERAIEKVATKEDIERFKERLEILERKLS